MKKLFLTAKEVANRWAEVGIRGQHDAPLSKRTIDGWRSNGTGPAYIKRYGKVLYPIGDLRKYEKTEFGVSIDATESDGANDNSTHEKAA